MEQRRVVFALVAALAPALLAVGCGGEPVPGSAIAIVDGEAIDKRSFDHWMSVAAKMSGRRQLPKPPDFAACVKEKRKATPLEGQPRLAGPELKQLCKEEYEALRDQVVQLLVSSRWLEAEARERGISVSEADVKKAADQQRKQKFPKKGQYEKFLEDSGQTQDDVLMRVRIVLLTNKLRQQVTKGTDKVTEEQISDYYNENTERFAQPEERDVRIVLTRTATAAERAKAALFNGRSWKAVAKERSIDQMSKSRGGKLLGLTDGERHYALDDAIFAARKGRLTGPVKTPFGYYVFKVTRVTPASQQNREQAKQTIKQLLISENQQEKVNDFAKQLRAKWKARTRCQERFLTQDCENAPNLAPTPAGQAGAPQP